MDKKSQLLICYLGHATVGLRPAYPISFLLQQRANNDALPAYYFSFFKGFLIAYR